VKQYLGYCRVSTENQKDDNTIQYQKDALQQYAQNNQIEIKTIFSDEGVSGSLENRPGLAQLLYSVEHNPEIEGVIIHKLDRLARDIVIQENLIKTFQSIDKRIISTLEPDLDSTDPTRKMIRQVLGVIAEYEKALITIRLSAGRVSKAARGGYSGGNVPFGYRVDRDNHSLVIDEQESGVVKKIWYLRRYKKLSYNKIADVLNDENIPSKTGKKWSAPTVHYIINNSVYRGNVTYGGVKTKGIHRPLL
jgi:site-specific DNA recombinase